MKKYIYWDLATTDAEAIIEADSHEEAEEIAEKIMEKPMLIHYEIKRR